LPNGGEALVIGNIIHQSKYTENSSLIHYGFPKKEAGQTFYIINNTASSSRHAGTFLMNHSPAEGVIVNNLLVGKLDMASGPHREDHNLAASLSCLLPTPARPCALAPKCGAIDSGAPLKNLNTVDLSPRFEYIHPLTKNARRIVDKIDIGAYEAIE